MRIVGEPVTIVTEKGGGYDRYGRELPVTRVKRTIDRAVVVPGTNSSVRDTTIDGQIYEATVLFPTFVDIQDGALVIVRGLEYEVDRPPFDHRSAFGTTRGGTEINIRRVEG